MPDVFDSALEFLHSSLSELHGHGVPLRTSRESLERLVNASRTAADTETIKTTLKPTAAEVSVNVAPVSPLDVNTPAPAALTAPRPPALDLSDGRSKADRLEELRGPVLACTLCPHLVRSRTQVVFGVGNPEAELMFVGEAPGEDEDIKGEPFVGKAGQLLTKIIETMGYGRDQVFIANVLKCRPHMPEGASGNRKPTASEMQTCLPYLERQISIVQPRVLGALGATAMEGLLGETAPMARLRGRWHEFRGIPLMATYHPAYLLRNQSLGEKRKVWEDMLLVLQRLGATISEKQRTYFLPK